MEHSSTKPEETFSQLISLSSKLIHSIADMDKSSSHSAALEALHTMEVINLLIQKHLAPTKTTGLRGEYTSPSPVEEIEEMTHTYAFK